MRQSLALEELFQNWMEGYPHIRPFYKDGIINEKQYNKQPTKLLFICKEPNEANHKQQVEKSFMIEWNETTPNYPFAKCIARWSFGILNDFPYYNETLEDISYLKKIAFMNLKKNHGSGESNALEINQFVKDHKLSLVKEIEIINPSTIILCVGFNESISQELFENISWQPSGQGVKITKWNNKKIIDFYHPSSRNAAPASYALLKNVFQSSAFQNL